MPLVQCEICFETIAACELEELKVPMLGAMFTSPDLRHGIPQPFPSDACWEDMRCPHCLHRPFIAANHIMVVTGTERARVEIGRKIGVIELPATFTSHAAFPALPTFPIACPVCGKELTNRAGYTGHMRMAHKQHVIVESQPIPDTVTGAL